MPRLPGVVACLVLGLASLAAGVSSNGWGDCVVQWGGTIRGPRTPCEDGAACDLDGLADGACLLDVAPCVDSSSSRTCPDSTAARAVVESSNGAAAAAVQAALDVLLSQRGSGPRCRSALVVMPVAHTRRRNRPITLHVTAETSAPYQRAEQDLDLYCLPAGRAPSLTNEIAPILETRCGVTGCHVGPTPRAGLDLSDRDRAHDGLLRIPKVRPDRPRRSTLLATIRNRRMPPGCRGRNGQPPPGGCLTRDERALLLEWILAGGPDN